MMMRAYLNIRKYIDMYDEIRNKINTISEVNDIMVKVNNKLKKNLSYIDKFPVLVVPSSIFYFVEGPEIIYKLNVKIEDTLNFVWFELYKTNRKNRISSDEVNTDKLKLFF